MVSIVSKQGLNQERNPDVKKQICLKNVNLILSETRNSKNEKQLSNMI
ncbi:hypothetical protein pb186bvf_001628 [Paramecium bursaria]